MKSETAALTDEVYLHSLIWPPSIPTAFSFEMNEPISEKAVQTKRDIIMETIADGSVGMEMKERIVAQQLDALVRAGRNAAVLHLLHSLHAAYLSGMSCKGAEPAAGRRF